MTITDSQRTEKATEPVANGKASHSFMKFKEKVETIHAIVTIIAILVGGWWGYKLFIHERKHYPHANLEQEVSHISLPDNVNLLRLAIGIENTGTSRLILKKSMIRIQQILPLLPCTDPKRCAEDQMDAALKEIDRREDRFSWPLISERIKIFEKPVDIEPGEKDVIDFEFVVSSNVQAVRIYSYFRNEEKTKGADEVGWAVSTYYDFRKFDGGEVQG